MIAYGSNLGLIADGGDLDSMSEMMSKMTPYRFGGGGVLWQAHWILGIITWILVVILLIALVRWVWKKGDKVK